MENIDNLNNDELFDDENPTTPISKLKDLFSDGKLPTGNDFGAIFDSYFHKDIKIPEQDIDGLINDLNSKEDKTDADKRFNDLNTAVKNLQDGKEDKKDADAKYKDLDGKKEDKTDADAKYKDLDSKKEDKTDADKRFGDLNTAVKNLQDNKEDKTDADAKYKDLDSKKEDKTDADKRFGDLNTAVKNLQDNKEDKTDADAKYKDLDSKKEDKTDADKRFVDLNTAVKNLQDNKEDKTDADAKYKDLDSKKEDKADMVNYLRIDPNGLQDNDIAIREGGKWVRKQASEVSTIKTLTLQQNGETLGTFDGKEDKTVNMDAPKTIEATYANINKHIEQDVELTGEEYCKKYQSIQSGSTVVKGSFSYSNNEIIKSPYGKFNTASATSLIAGKDPINGYQALFMVGENGTTVNPLIKELLLLDIKPNTYSSGWTRMLNDHNFNEYAPKKDGTGATGTWNINVQGSSNSASYAAAADHLNSFYTGKVEPPSTFKGKGLALNMSHLLPNLGTQGYCDLLYLNGYNNQAADVAWCNAIAFQKTSEDHGDVYHATGDTDTGKAWRPWHKFIDDVNIYQYAGNTLTITVNGAAVGSYNGASNQTINIPAPPGYVHPANERGGHSADNITTTPNNRFCSDSEKAKWNIPYVPITGNTMINGSLTATGGFFEQSDASIKSNVQNIDLSAAKDLHLVEFDRIDTNRHGYGVIAQEVEKLYPTVVTTDEHSGIKQVNYNEVYAIKLAYLESKIQELENRLEKAESLKTGKKIKSWKQLFRKQ